MFRIEFPYNEEDYFEKYESLLVPLPESMYNNRIQLYEVIKNIIDNINNIENQNNIRKKIVRYLKDIEQKRKEFKVELKSKKKTQYKNEIIEKEELFKRNKLFYEKLKEIYFLLVKKELFFCSDKIIRNIKDKALVKRYAQEFYEKYKKVKKEIGWHDYLKLDKIQFVNKKILGLFRINKNNIQITFNEIFENIFQAVEKKQYEKVYILADVLVSVMA